VVFRNAYTPSPICIPGCQCLMAVQLLHGVTAPARVDLFAAGIQLRHDAVEVGVHLGDFSRREHTSGVVVAVFLEKLLNLLVQGVSLSVFGVSLPAGTTSACCPKGACLGIAFCYKTRLCYTNPPHFLSIIALWRAALRGASQRMFIQSVHLSRSSAEAFMAASLAPANFKLLGKDV
jgi:hypothetical protein